MAGLKRRVLAVVDEAQQLAGFVGELEFRHVLEEAQRGQHQDRRRTAAALGGQRPDTREVIATESAIAGAAAQAEADRLLHPPHGEAIRILLAVRRHAQGLGKLGAHAALDHQDAVLVLEEIVRDPSGLSRLIFGPLAEIEVTFGADGVVSDVPARLASHKRGASGRVLLPHH